MERVERMLAWRHTVEHDACRYGSIEQEKKGMHEAKFLTCWTCTTATTANICKSMRSRRCSEQLTRVREDIAKKMQHDKTRSLELPSKEVWHPQSMRGEER